MPVRTREGTLLSGKPHRTPRVECLFSKVSFSSGRPAVTATSSRTACQHLSRQLVHIADVPSFLLAKISALRGQHSTQAETRLS
jgi:hypothetical protein